MKGRCSCGAVEFALHDSFLFVHACHCSGCQRQTGSAFALNGLIETALVEVTRGHPQGTDVPAPSGHGQRIMHCPDCQTALWSHYGGSGAAIAFIRVGTLDQALKVRSSAHIYTSTKQPWLGVDDGAPVFEAFYRRSQVWPAAALARRQAALEAR